MNNNRFSLPTEYILYNVYPNPFNPITVFNYAVPEQGQIVISLYNMLGREIVKLYTGNQVPGYYSIRWDASKYSSGVYFIKMIASDYIDTQKLLFIK